MSQEEDGSEGVVVAARRGQIAAFIRTHDDFLGPLNDLNDMNTDTVPLALLAPADSPGGACRFGEPFAL